MKPVFITAALLTAVCLFGPTPADAGLAAPAAPASCHHGQPALAPVPAAPVPAQTTYQTPGHWQYMPGETVTVAAPALAPVPACSTCVTPAAAPPVAAAPGRLRVLKTARLATWRANRAAKPPRAPRLTVLDYTPAPALYYTPAANLTMAPTPAHLPPCEGIDLGE